MTKVNTEKKVKKVTKKTTKTIEEVESEVKQNVAKKTDKEVIEEYIESNRDQLREHAKTISERTYGNWFDIQRFMKKTTFKTIQDAFQLLNLLKLAGYLIAKYNEVRKVEEYKIVLSQEEIKEYLLLQLALHDEKRKQLEKELIECESKIK